MAAGMFCLQTNSRRFILKRFHFNDDDEENEEDNEDKFLNSEFFSIPSFPLGSEGILPSAVKICEKLLFWKFYSLQTKLNKIKEVYIFLRDLEEEEGNDINA